jgi:CheY-like chemotaxis protein
MTARTILIVEDVEACATTLEIALLQIDGIDVQVVRRAADALELLRSGDNICALVTDLHLPRMDGYELIERVRATGSLAGLPIVVVSGDTDPLVDARLRSLGADAYFPKPFSPAEVRSRVQELLLARA